MLLGLGIYVGTHREGATCFVFNGAVREKDKKLFDNARNVGGGREGKLPRYAFTVTMKKQRPLYQTGSNDVLQSLYLKASWLTEK